MPILNSVRGNIGVTGFNSGLLVGDFESIATVTVGTATPTVTFSSIPATYTHLQIRASLQTARANAPLDKVFWHFNSDTTSSYSSHHFFSNHETVSATTDNTTKISGSDLFASASSNSGLAFGSLILDILDYGNTNKFKTCLAISGFDTNGVVQTFRGRQGFISGNYRSTNAITSVTFTVDNAANFSVNSKFALYGVKA